MGCMDSFDPDPRIAQALAAGGDAGPRWVTMDTYFYTLDHFLNAMDWHRSFLPPARISVGFINSRRRGTKPDGLPLHNVSVQGWAARAHALHAANISHISIWLMPLSDEFLWWIPRWKDRCQQCGVLSCFQPSANCSNRRMKADDAGLPGATFDVTTFGADPTGAKPSDGAINTAIAAINQRCGSSVLLSAKSKH